MSGDADERLQGPDLGSHGAASGDIPEGRMLLGRFQGEAVLLVRKAGRVYAIGAKCTHYGGPLAEGVFDGKVVLCPWHHACFAPESGEAACAPATHPVSSYTVEERDGHVFVRGVREPKPRPAPAPSTPESVVIVGGGAAGFAAAEMLRREGYSGSISLVSADAFAPYDRPNVSKDYLAGNAQPDWMPLRPMEWYRESRIDLLLGQRVAAIDPARRAIRMEDGASLKYGALLLATGASPVRLPIPGSDLPHVHYLRTQGDSDAIIDRAKQSQEAVVVGASFIGLEVAASLSARGSRVHVVGLEKTPMERVLGPELGAFIRTLHESHGVRFHMGQTVAAIEERTVRLQDGTNLDAGLVVLGVGVRPNVELAEAAGLRIDRGVLVDEYLRTSADGIWAAGDIARWPDPYSGERIRVEHWVVAERQGQTAARNMLGRREPYRTAPFFWSQHYDVPINYVGFASSWDEIHVAGSIQDRDCLVAYRKAGKTLAVATMNRDIPSLEAQLAMERGDPHAVDAAALVAA